MKKIKIYKNPESRFVEYKEFCEDGTLYSFGTEEITNDTREYLKYHDILTWDGKSYTPDMEEYTIMYVYAICYNNKNHTKEEISELIKKSKELQKDLKIIENYYVSVC